MRRITWAVFCTELRQLMRDRRALFAAVILPALLYPFLFWTTEQVERSGEEILAAREVLLALDLEELPSEVAMAARAGLGGQTPIQVFDVEAEELREFEVSGNQPTDPDQLIASRRVLYDRLLKGGGHALVTGVQDGERSLFRIYYDVKDDESREAQERARTALNELDARMTTERREMLLGVDPAARLSLRSEDIARAEDASGAAMGRWLPLLAVLVLLSGGSYAALAVFAGERESGTLETLLVQPVGSRPIVNGKFLCVLLAGAVTLFMNVGSLIVCGLAGIADLPGFGGEAGPGVMRFASGLVYLPGAVLLCAVLCLVCGKARTFREGQQTILPVMIITALPTAIVMQPDLETSYLFAALPFAGAALCLRDAMAGELALGATLVMTVAHAGWAWIVLGRLGALLDAERVLSSASTEEEAALRQESASHGKRWAFVSVLLMYIVGTRIQQWDLFWGLGFTLWGLVIVLAIATATRGRSEGLVRELKLGAPPPAHLFGALLCVPAIAWLMSEVILPWQLEVLPMPSTAGGGGLEATLMSTSPWLLFFLFALSPGICEELLFRGAILSSLKRDLSATRAVLIQALFFALMHLSVYRLLPTFLLGVLLGALTLRARSLWPAVLAHTAYNGMLVVGWDAPAWLPVLAIAGLVLVMEERD